ncbi:TPA: type IV toxin-antitoxin system YeeU family antitoxin, partial [Escherichia coli]
RNPSDLCPWHMDETYVKVNGRWAYLYHNDLTCEADTFGSCGYVYLAVYPTPETKK